MNHSRPTYSYSVQATSADSSGHIAIVAVIMGVMGLFLWCCPFVGVLISGLGLALGIHAREASPGVVSTTAIVLCAIGLFLSVGIVLL